MTREEARSLGRARETGFLAHRSSQKCLIDEWSQWCQQSGRSCLRVERTAGRAQLVLSTGRAAQPLSDEQQRRVRELLNSLGELQPGALWPIVYRFGAYSQPLEPAVANSAAHTLARLVDGFS